MASRTNGAVRPNRKVAGRIEQAQNWLLKEGFYERCVPACAFAHIFLQGSTLELAEIMFRATSFELHQRIWAWLKSDEDTAKEVRIRLGLEKPRDPLSTSMDMVDLGPYIRRWLEGRVERPWVE